QNKFNKGDTMNKNFKWYWLITLSLVSLILYTGYFMIGEDEDVSRNEVSTDDPLISNNKNENGNKLPIPPLLENKNTEESKAELALEVQSGRTEFKKCKETDTEEYNEDQV